MDHNHSRSHMEDNIVGPDMVMTRSLGFKGKDYQKLKMKIHIIWKQSQDYDTRFQREPSNYVSQPKKVNDGIVKNSFATVLKTGQINTTIPPKPSPSIVLDDSCLMERDFSYSLMGKIKDINALSNLYLILANEGFENVKVMCLGGFWVLLDVDSLASKEKIRKHVGLLHGSTN
ncbi:hypothetical protein Tco_0897329 [Tanacetum coccineum]